LAWPFPPFPSTPRIKIKGVSEEIPYSHVVRRIKFFDSIEDRGSAKLKCVYCPCWRCGDRCTHIGVHEVKRLSNDLLHVGLPSRDSQNHSGSVQCILLVTSATTVLQLSVYLYQLVNQNKLR
jgi:hypothetical protein